MPSRRLERPIVAVAEDLACVDMVDGRLIENLHVDDVPPHLSRESGEILGRWAWATTAALRAAAQHRPSADRLLVPHDPR